ncbi:hypothetical protein V6Z12_A03G157300 [Gossypium hirsutum]
MLEGLFFPLTLVVPCIYAWAAKEELERAAGDSQTEDVRHTIYYLILYYASSTLARQ